MLSTFGSLNTALTTLQAMQKSIQTTSHNVANAATPGYSRQQATLVSGTPYTVPSTNRYNTFGQVGTGVNVEKMQRFRSAFLDSQIRNETLREKGWEVRQDALQQIEVSFNEPSDTGINSRLSAFWASWNNLATTPDSAATRGTVVESAADLTAALRDTYRQLEDFQTELDDQVAIQVESINDVPALQSEYEADLLAAGFERDYRYLTLRRGGSGTRVHVDCRVHTRMRTKQRRCANPSQ